MKEQITKLLEKSDEFIFDAALLLNNKRYASSVSRSYYAMFHAAQAMLLTKQIVAHTHKGVILNFNNAFVKTNLFDNQLSKAFSKIQDKREKSDYEIGFKATMEHANETYQTAVSFLNEVKKYVDE